MEAEVKGHVGHPAFLKVQALEQPRSSPVTITRANGTVRVVDPVTREERTQEGRLIRVVPGTGFNAPPRKKQSLPHGATKAERARRGELNPWYGPEDVDPGVGAMPARQRRRRGI